LIIAQKREQRRQEAVFQARLELQSDDPTPLSSLPDTINGTRKRKRQPKSRVSSSGVVKRQIDYGSNMNSLQHKSSHLSREQSSLAESTHTPFSFGLSPDVSRGIGRRSL
jgi:hypothetical protein